MRPSARSPGEIQGAAAIHGRVGRSRGHYRNDENSDGQNNSPMSRHFKLPYIVKLSLRPGPGQLQEAIRILA
jgi:hypothetical protein